MTITHQETRIYPLDMNELFPLCLRTLHGMGVELDHQERDLGILRGKLPVREALFTGKVGLSLLLSPVAGPGVELSLEADVSYSSATRFAPANQPRQAAQRFFMQLEDALALSRRS
ncbi:MAG: hypothetical protein HY869_24245 [Chloroflexi bacterium]|nr:hypothetical protein [Chloroflexota bacterium]